MSETEQRELIERLTIGVEFSRLVLACLVKRAGGEIRISQKEIDSFDNALELAQLVDESRGELILRLERGDEATTRPSPEGVVPSQKGAGE